MSTVSTHTRRARLPLTRTGGDRLVLVGGTVFDGTLADPLENGEVEIDGATITYVGPRRTSHGADTTCIDFAGGYVTPGFIDTHVHLAMPNGISQDEMKWWFPEEEAFANSRSLRTTLEAGVTTARDLSGLAPGYRRSVARGDIEGPRLHLAISLLSPTGGHGDPLAPNGALPVWAERATCPGWAVVDTDEDVMRTVRRLDRIGADVIKVCTTGGMSSHHDSPAELGIPEHQVALIVKEMERRRGQPVTAHAQSPEGIAAAVRGGAASIEHGYGLSEDIIHEMLERGTALVPTLAALFRPMPDGSESAEAADLRAQRQASMLATVQRAHEAGVPIATGTDAGLPAHGRNLAELGLLARAGLTSLQAINSATQVGARVLGLDDRIGTLEVGKFADLTILNVDPLDSIESLANADSVRLVCQSGRVVKDLDGIALSSRAGSP